MPVQSHSGTERFHPAAVHLLQDVTASQLEMAAFCASSAAAGGSAGEQIFLEGRRAAALRRRGWRRRREAEDVCTASLTIHGCGVHELTVGYTKEGACKRCQEEEEHGGWGAGARHRARPQNPS